MMAAIQDCIPTPSHHHSQRETPPTSPSYYHNSTSQSIYVQSHTLHTLTTHTVASLIGSDISVITKWPDLVAIATRPCPPSSV